MDGTGGATAKSSPFPKNVPRPQWSPRPAVVDELEVAPEVVMVHSDPEEHREQERSRSLARSLSSSGASPTRGGTWRGVLDTGPGREGDNEHYYYIKTPSNPQGRGAREESPLTGSDARSAPTSPSTLSSLMSVQYTPAWRKWVDAGRERLDIVIDSGSSASMLPVSVAPKHELRPGGGRTYTSASQTKVQELGTKQLTLGLQDGTSLQSNREVGEIHRPLASVSKMTAKGNTVIFAPEEKVDLGR